MVATLGTRYVRDGGPAIAYQVVGDGDRDIFYVGQPSPPIDLMWDDPLLARGLRRLASAGRLVTCDLRGWGSSDAVDPTDLPALQAWMDDIGRVMDAVGSERSVLIGQSEQGLPCMMFAASHPERVLALVLWSPFARYLRAADHPWGMPEEAAAEYSRQFGEIIGSGMLSTLFAPSRADEPGFLEWYARSERLGLRPAGSAPIYGGVFQPSDLRDLATSITVPTLLLRRKGDPHVRYGHAHQLEATMPNATLVELDGADHLWWSGDTDAPIDEMLAFITGLRASAGRPERQLATVLITDIVGSTQRAAEMGDDAWSARRARHDELTSRFVAAFRGRVVKFTGDGVLATFDGPARAIRCACDLRDALSAEELPIRAGLHTGEVERAGDDIHGLTVHAASRIAALADAGEVLVSAALPTLVLGSRLEFQDRGPHDLKGLPGQWQLLAVAGTP